MTGEKVLNFSMKFVRAVWHRNVHYQLLDQPTIVLNLSQKQLTINSQPESVLSPWESAVLGGVVIADADSVLLMQTAEKLGDQVCNIVDEKCFKALCELNKDFPNTVPLYKSTQDTVSGLFLYSSLN